MSRYRPRDCACDLCLREAKLPEIYDNLVIAGTIGDMNERRHCNRKNLDLFFNKFLNGHPYLCRTVDVSPTGLLAVTYTEPDTQQQSFPVELRLADSDDSLWLWARTVRWAGRKQAMQFLRMDRRARARLRALFLAGAPDSAKAQSLANS
jgi:hypothetical protein